MSVFRKRGGKHSYYIDLGVIDKESIQKEKGGLAIKKYMGEINVFQFRLTKVCRAVLGVVFAAVVAAGVVGNVNDVTKFDKKEPVISNSAANVNDMASDILTGKTLYVAGDSIAYGTGSEGGFGKAVARKYGMTFINEAADGATLAPNIADNVNGGTRACICTIVTSSDALEKADYILLEGGINDAWNKAAVGTLTDGFDAVYDEMTMTGALEKTLGYLAKNHSEKRVAYVFPHGGLFADRDNWYKTYKPAILAVLQKWDVPYVDIEESAPPMGPYGSSRLSDKYTSDGIHPNTAGYEQLYMEPIAALLMDL